MVLLVWNCWVEVSVLGVVVVVDLLELEFCAGVFGILFWM